MDFGSFISFDDDIVAMVSRLLKLDAIYATPALARRSHDVDKHVNIARERHTSCRLKERAGAEEMVEHRVLEDRVDGFDRYMAAC